MFLFPVKKIKLVFKDNFYSGLILGAIFSLVVNIASMQIQATIEKQRVLEAIEYEIVSHSVISSTNLNAAINERKNKTSANRLTTNSIYSTNVWNQSIEPHLYVAQLDPAVQVQVNGYYTFLVPRWNDVIMISNRIYERDMTECFNYKIVLSNKEQIECNENYYNYLEDNALYPGKAIHDSAIKVLSVFHPTQDRLNNPWLRFVMGSNSLNILSGK